MEINIYKPKTNNNYLLVTCKDVIFVFVILLRGLRIDIMMILITSNRQISGNNKYMLRRMQNFTEVIETHHIGPARETHHIGY
jgi:hypothetical protein